MIILVRLNCAKKSLTSHTLRIHTHVYLFTEIIHSRDLYLIRGRFLVVALFLTFFCLGHDFGGWWIGSYLDVHTARSLTSHVMDLVGHVGPTALQVGCSLAAAICWAIRNPNMGANFPENLPSQYIVDLAKPWLGSWVSVRSDWKPNSAELSRKSSTTTSCSSSSSESDDSDIESEGTSSSSVDIDAISKSTDMLSDEIWQFKNFVISDSGLNLAVNNILTV